MLKKELKELLLNDKILTRITVNEINQWTKCNNLVCVQYYENDESFLDSYFEHPSELAKAISNGNFNYKDPFVRFNKNGGLDSSGHEDYSSDIDLIIDSILECVDKYHTDFYEEIKEIIEKYS